MRRSLDHVQGGDCIQKVTLEAGVLRSLTATKMRHRAATKFANLEMSESDRQFFFSHIGHSEDVNKNIYQCPPALRKLQVGSYLTEIDGETSVPENNDKQADETILDQSFQQSPSSSISGYQATSQKRISNVARSTRQNSSPRNARMLGKLSKLILL